MIATPLLNCTIKPDRLELAAVGAWTAAIRAELEGLIEAAGRRLAMAQHITIDMAGVSALDTLGAWLLERFIRDAGRAGKEAQFVGLEHFSIRLGVARVCEISFAFVFGNPFEKRGDCSPQLLNSARLHLRRVARWD